MGNYNPPLISCDNIKIKRNHSYALCKQSYQRTRHPPRRVLSFLRDGLPQGDRYDRCIGKEVLRRQRYPLLRWPCAKPVYPQAMIGHALNAKCFRLALTLRDSNAPPIEIMSLL
ncbi:hypothetical protein RHECIAT_CH0003442 [Rhizobium etli CIAT 652]|uniref:Uncharacterized protein n=1 Tax=Rhizobium etli (strain CIAT 652) TaxID=491916 RepID=B3PWF2_RHIE6|nr:hypothetical protein RHECIAT_CH0003442 [Rhizobium etli CIAT 652]